MQTLTTTEPEEAQPLTPEERAKRDAEHKKKKFFDDLHRLRKTYRFDLKIARRIIHFFERRLTHVEGELAGKPFLLERWQKKCLRRIFGWRRKDNGLRRFKTVLWFVPRKNGKSAIGSGIGGYLLDADVPYEGGAKIVSVASNTEQAGAVFEAASSMIAANPFFAHERGILPLKSSIVCYRTRSNWKLISGKKTGKHGKNLHGILFDELHEIEGHQLHDAIKRSTGARRQPLLIYFTTAGWDKNSLCYKIYERAKRIQSGEIIDDTFLPIIYEAPKDADWRDPKVWAMANPNLGVSKYLATMQQECQEAMEIPAFENAFRQYQLNQWTEQEDRMFSLGLWKDNAGAFNEKDLIGRECWGGLDLATTNDIAAFVLCFPIDKKIVVKPYFWIPRETAAKRSRDDGVEYMKWIEDGLIKTTEGDMVDYEQIYLDLLELKKKYKIRGVNADPYNATHLSQRLINAGIQVTFHLQHMNVLSPPTKHTIQLLISRRIMHGGNRVLQWMAMNTAAERGAGKDPPIRPSKKKSQEKIDGIIGMILGIAGCQAGEAVKKSAYESRGVQRI